MKTKDGVEFTAGMTLYHIEFDRSRQWIETYETDQPVYSVHDGLLVGMMFPFGRDIDCMYADRINAYNAMIQSIDSQRAELYAKLNDALAEIGRPPVHSIPITEARAKVLLAQHSLAGYEGYPQDDDLVTTLELHYPHLKRNNYYRAVWPDDPVANMEERLRDAGYHLRDDREIRTGVEEFKGHEEAYSLFTDRPMERHGVFAGKREWAVQQAYKQVFGET